MRVARSLDSAHKEQYTSARPQAPSLHPNALSCHSHAKDQCEREVIYPWYVWIWILISMLLLPASAYQPGAVLHITPQTTQIRTGDTTTVDLMLGNVQGLYGIEIHLQFDPQTIQVIDAIPGTDGVQIKPGALPMPDYVLQNEANNAVGTIDYAATQLPPTKPGQGSGVIAQITFRGIEPSTSFLQFERFLLADTAGGTLDAQTVEGRIVVVRRSRWMLYTAVGAALALTLGGIGYLALKRC
jgi:hypothetical protein